MKKKILLCLVSIFLTVTGYSFDLKTHLWIAQQLLNEVIKNKVITINGKQYKLNDQVHNALINHPSEFRIGTLGIDVFPDPIVGQITAHPGLSNGWKTDDWIQHVLNSASKPAEIAFAYGYACHAAMDIFAHTYVNAYSGDIFLLTDETAVERRHFALEKYIGNHLPKFLTVDGQVITDYESLISAPEGFLSKTFILNNDVTDQYIKSGSLHLVAMNGVYNTVRKLDETNQNIIKLLGLNYLDLLKEQQRLILELDKKVGLTAQAGLQLKLSKEALDLKIAANNVLLDKIKIERQLINNGIQAKKDIEKLISLKHKVIEDANSLITNLETQIIDKETQAAKIATDILFLPLTVSSEITEYLRKWIPGLPYPCGDWRNPGKMCSSGSWIREAITRTVKIANPEIERLKKQKNQLIDQVANARKQIVNSKSDIVSASNVISAKTEELNNLITNIALAEANELNYKTQKELLEKEVEVLKTAYNEAQKIHEKVKREEEELRGRLEAYVDEFINLAKKLIEKYNLVHLMLKNWEGDIEKASKNYITAGEAFSKDIVTGKGNGFSHYLNWYKCWSPVFTAVPSEIPEAVCTLDDYYKKINAEIDNILNDLGPLKYLIDPTRKLKEEVEKEAKKKLEYASVQISNHLFGKQTTDFFLMITGREAVTTSKLIEIFKEDGSGKSLITFENITTLINKEMGLMDDSHSINMEQFAAFHNAMQLSKLAVLPAQSLNKLHFDHIGNKRTSYGKTLYPEVDNSKFTLLMRAVSSIDGSSQWMHTALPLYRNTGFDGKWPNDRQYGYSRCENDNNGFRFWVDKSSRNKIFNVIFKGPLTPELYSFASYNSENTRFISCNENPFPNTENNNCRIFSSDTFCQDNSWKRFFKMLFGSY